MRDESEIPRLCRNVLIRLVKLTDMRFRRARLFKVPCSRFADFGPHSFARRADRLTDERLRRDVGQGLRPAKDSPFTLRQSLRANGAAVETSMIFRSG